MGAPHSKRKLAVTNPEQSGQHQQQCEWIQLSGAVQRRLLLQADQVQDQDQSQDQAAMATAGPAGQPTDPGPGEVVRVSKREQSVSGA